MCSWTVGCAWAVASELQIYDCLWCQRWQSRRRDQPSALLSGPFVGEMMLQDNVCGGNRSRIRSPRWTSRRCLSSRSTFVYTWVVTRCAPVALPHVNARAWLGMSSVFHASDMQPILCDGCVCELFTVVHGTEINILLGSNYTTHNTY